MHYFKRTAFAAVVAAASLAGVLVAWALLHEPVSGAFLAGAALVFGGVWLVTRGGSAA